MSRKQKPGRRTGPQLTFEEKTAAVLRVMGGEPLSEVAADHRVTEATAAMWVENWSKSDGPWSSWAWLRLVVDGVVVVDGEAGEQRQVDTRELTAMEAAAGYVLELREFPDFPHARKVPVKGHPDPALQALATAEAREQLIHLLKFVPTEAIIEKQIRAWKALDDRSREVLTPAWDMYQLAVYAMQDAHHKRKLALELVEQGLAYERAADERTGRVAA